ncbi:hypothetical protein ZEAMMB73_Zm00001d010489 [Zea mays]|uniref:Uncharacterized protein n=1 Tax=Zea mays TaxID=4577 RepID=A0A1D6FRD4_MAIZE|nr:hypothetical protein ZEAMMB73_Zm00001d010489 [Zea mays]
MPALGPGPLPRGTPERNTQQHLTSQPPPCSISFLSLGSSALLPESLASLPRLLPSPWTDSPHLRFHSIRSKVNSSVGGARAGKRREGPGSEPSCTPHATDTQVSLSHADLLLLLSYRLMRAYISSSSLRKSALRALAKALTTDQLFYLREQFTLFGPNKSGHISLQRH